jgi:GNAT superfamily N-acetyltransferase
LTGAVRIESRHNSGGSQFHGIGVDLPPDVHFLFKSYVLPVYRGRRLHAALVQAALAHPDKGNVVALITTTGLTNGAFLNSVVKLGFKRRGLAIEWVLNGRHRYRLPAPIGINATAAAEPAGEQHYIRFFSGHSCRSHASSQ